MGGFEVNQIDVVLVKEEEVNDALLPFRSKEGVLVELPRFGGVFEARERQNPLDLRTEFVILDPRNVFAGDVGEFHQAVELFAIAEFPLINGSLNFFGSAFSIDFFRKGRYATEVLLSTEV